MSDDPKKRGSQDRSRANTTKTTKFGVSPDKFKAAVKKIGNSVADVQRELVSGCIGVGSSQTDSEGPCSRSAA